MQSRMWIYNVDSTIQLQIVVYNRFTIRTQCLANGIFYTFIEISHRSFGRMARIALANSVEPNLFTVSTSENVRLTL